MNDTGYQSEGTVQRMLFFAILFYIDFFSLLSEG